MTRVHLELQDVTERRVLKGLLASLADQVLLVTMVQLETQEMLGNKDLLDLKVSQVYLVILVFQAIAVQLDLASCWLSTVSQFWCQSAPQAAVSFGWATVSFTWRVKRRLTHKT